MSGPTLFERFMPASQPSNITTIACPQCGTGLPTPEESHQRILDLEAQVKSLNLKAAAAVDKLADYEDEVRSLRAQCAQLQQPLQTPQTQPSEASTSPPQNSTQLSPPRASSRLASLSSFLPGRRKDLPNGALLPSNLGFNHSTPNLSTTSNLQVSSTVQIATDSLNAQIESQTPPPDFRSLETSLEKERSLRIRAESSLTQTQTELEELTATLFGQANEMVATERRARAKLEERVKMLETRDTEKRRRLDRLEQSLKRIERVRGLVERRGTPEPNRNGDDNVRDIEGREQKLTTQKREIG